MHRLLRVATFSLGLGIALQASAQVGCVPNPNNNGLPFTDACPLSAAGINKAFDELPSKIPGCAGDGVTDDTGCLQAALDHAVFSGLPLNLGPYHYAISSAITHSGTFVADVEGVSGRLDVYVSSCPLGVSSIIVNSNISALVLNDLTDTVRGICFQMATASGSRTMGAAIVVGSTTSTNNGNSIVQGNTLIFPYDGILVGGPAEAPQTNSTHILENVIISPSDRGVWVGKSSTHDANPGTDFRGNQIACFSANTNAIGIEFDDGAGYLDLGDSGPYNCNVGTEVRPGAGQIVCDLVLSGVIGDSSITNDLLIDTVSPSGTVKCMKLVSPWATTTNIATATPILIENTGGGTVENISISNPSVWVGAGSPLPAIDIEAGQRITINGGQVCAAGPSTGPMLKLGSAASSIVVNGIDMSPCGGSSTTGIQIVGGGAGTGMFTITNNIMPQITPLLYTPNNETAFISGNLGLSNIGGTVASAGTISFSNNETDYISGTTAITNITNSAWSFRSHRVIVRDALTFSSSGSGAGKICAPSVTLAAGQAATVDWDAPNSCWHVH